MAKENDRGEKGEKVNPKTSLREEHPAQLQARDG
jgi:hypothetical protein